MKRYDLHKIMKRAHGFYKNAREKYPTFSDCLRKAWKMAKFEAEIEDKLVVMNQKKKDRKMDASKQAMGLNVNKVVKSESYQWPTSVNASAIYPENSRGFMGSKYCGD